MNVDAIANVVAAILFWGFLGSMACSLMWSEFVGMGKMFIQLGQLIVELAGDVWTMLLPAKQAPPAWKSSIVADAAQLALRDEIQRLSDVTAQMVVIERLSSSALHQDDVIYIPKGQHNTALLALMKQIECGLGERKMAMQTTVTPPMEYVACLEERGIDFDEQVEETAFQPVPLPRIDLKLIGKETH
jgi:hypothetical protein